MIFKKIPAMKKLLLSLLFLSFFSFSYGQFTQIPDTSFESRLIELGFDDALDGSVLTANIENMDILYIQRRGIKSLKGIEDFKGLTELYCGHNELTKLDVSNNIKLIKLHCIDNQLKKLDVTNNLDLKDFYFMNNEISKIDVSKNTKLMYLNAQENQLTSIDVTKNTELTFLDCSYNQLTSIDLSNNKHLWSLHLWDNPLKKIDVTNSPNLRGLTLSSTQISEIDLSMNPKLGTFHASFTLLKKLDFSHNPELQSIRCANNPRLTCIDMSKQNFDNKIFSIYALRNPALSCIDLDSSYIPKLSSYQIFIDDMNVFSSGCYNNCNVVPSDTSSIFLVYPNPTISNSLNLDLGRTEKNVVAIIRDNAGLVLKTLNLGSSNFFTFDLGLKQGCYFLEVRFDVNQVRTTKFMVID